MIRQLFDRDSCTYTYIISNDENNDCVVIDPVLELFERDVSLLTEWGLTPRLTLETHTHADHITAANLLRDKFDCKIGVSYYGDVEGADLYLKDNAAVSFGDEQVKILHTPGHTKESVCFLFQNNLFSGDTLLIRGCGRTDFQGGSADQLYQSIQAKVFTLPNETKVLPGHDYKGRQSSYIGEEKKHNPRLTKSQSEFRNLMENLGLPYPAKIDVAVPANNLLRPS